MLYQLFKILKDRKSDSLFLTACAWLSFSWRKCTIWEIRRRAVTKKNNNKNQISEIPYKNPALLQLPLPPMVCCCCMGRVTWAWPTVKVQYRHNNELLALCSFLYPSSIFTTAQGLSQVCYAIWLAIKLFSNCAVIMLDIFINPDFICSHPKRLNLCRKPLTYINLFLSDQNLEYKGCTVNAGLTYNTFKSHSW